MASSLVDNLQWSMCSRLDCIPTHSPADFLFWPPFLESSESFPVHVYRKIEGWYSVVATDGDLDRVEFEFDVATDDNK